MEQRLPISCCTAELAPSSSEADETIVVIKPSADISDLSCNTLPVVLTPGGMSAAREVYLF